MYNFLYNIVKFSLKEEGLDSMGESGCLLAIFISTLSTILVSLLIF